MNTFLRNECGITAIEYGLLIGAFCLAVIGLYPTAYSKIAETFSHIIYSLAAVSSV